NEEVFFTVEGPGKIIGVGNGDPTSLENEQFLDDIQTFAVIKLQEKLSSAKVNETEALQSLNHGKWQNAFTDERDQAFAEKYPSVVYKGTFNLPANYKEGTFKFFYNSIGKSQSL